MKAAGNEKYCPKCQQTQTLDNFYASKRGADKLRLWCKNCEYALHQTPKYKERRKQYWAEHYPLIRETANARSRAWTRQLKLDTLGAYSNGLLVCDCCGESHIEFLSLDHVGGGGNQELKAANMGSYKLHITLRKEGFPNKERYRVLCHNCNQAFGRRGYCPHAKRN